MKKVLVLYYTQTGQLQDIADSFLGPLEAAGAHVEKVRVTMQKEFSFPWNSPRFFDAMPESVLQQPAAIVPFRLKEDKYDLVVFAYQPWFLSPSIPANSILHYPPVRAVLKNTPVITLIGARNMWLNAQEKIKKTLKEADALLVGNIALVDNNPNILSAVTILYWMMTGKKDKYLGVFPTPGVMEEDIRHAAAFGQIAVAYVLKSNYAGMQQQLAAAGAVVVKSNLMFIEERAGKLFNIWANVIIKKKNRAAWLVVFKYYLLFALFIVAPIVLTINFLLFRLFFLGVNKRKKQYYMGVQ